MYLNNITEKERITELQKKAVKYFCDKPRNISNSHPFNCCESILLALKDSGVFLGEGFDWIPKIGTGIGAGVSLNGLLCGAISSVAIAIGIKHGRSNLETNPEVVWDMVEKYQLVNRPEGRNEPDWAAKIHFTIAPCYYHNYLLGELLASQLHNHIVRKVLKLKSAENVSYVDRKKAGDFLREDVFEAAALYHWNEMIRRATGEPLRPKYFVAEFVK